MPDTVLSTHGKTKGRKRRHCPFKIKIHLRATPNRLPFLKERKKPSASRPPSPSTRKKQRKGTNGPTCSIRSRISARTYFDPSHTSAMHILHGFFISIHPYIPPFPLPLFDPQQNQFTFTVRPLPSACLITPSHTPDSNGATVRLPPLRQTNSKPHTEISFGPPGDIIRSVRRYPFHAQKICSANAVTIILIIKQLRTRFYLCPPD